MGLDSSDADTRSTHPTSPAGYKSKIAIRPWAIRAQAERPDRHPQCTSLSTLPKLLDGTRLPKGCAAGYGSRRWRQAISVVGRASSLTSETGRGILLSPRRHNLEAFVLLV